LCGQEQTVFKNQRMSKVLTKPVQNKISRYFSTLPDMQKIFQELKINRRQFTPEQKKALQANIP
jgi:hypothetical protein